MERRCQRTPCYSSCRRSAKSTEDMIDVVLYFLMRWICCRRHIVFCMIEYIFIFLFFGETCFLFFWKMPMHFWEREREMVRSDVSRQGDWSGVHESTNQMKGAEVWKTDEITMKLTQRIHGTGVFPYIYHRFKPHVVKYTSPMDPMELMQQ